MGERPRIAIDGTTDDNGEKLNITVRSDGRGYLRAVNGRIDRFDDTVRALAFWNKDTLDHDSFFSVVEDETLKVTFHFVARERIAVAGAALDAEHYRMIGDEERDLWFDHVARVEFRRQGSNIAYVRDQLTPLKPESLCRPPC